MNSTVYNEIERLFREHGDTEYFGEPVSQTEHALQAAQLAINANAPANLIVAALLHDIGHLLHGQGEGVAAAGVDARHEAEGEAWLAAWFGPEVTEPVKLHVPAKRYLCATNPGYLAALSPASVQSLALQGGPFTPEEAADFESNPHYRAAVQLRAWDDRAKIPGWQTPPLEEYRTLIEQEVKR